MCLFVIFMTHIRSAQITLCGLSDAMKKKHVVGDDEQKNRMHQINASYNYIKKSCRPSHPLSCETGAVVMHDDLWSWRKH